MIQAAKGTKDILPSESLAWQFLETKFLEVCRLFGYGEIRVPTFEATELFQRGVGDTTDVVQKEMYTFIDRGDRSITLRPEITAGVVRAYMEHGLFNLPSPQKLCYNHTAFRYEKMGKGRFREFHQFGCECFGSSEASADVELIALLHTFFKSVGLKDISLHINAIGCPECRGQYLEKLKDFLRPHLNELCRDCQNRFERNPMRSLDCKNEKCQAIIADAPVPMDCLCENCQKHFDSVCEQLTAMRLPFTVDKHIVRGLDYYTRTVFEFVSDNVGTQGTICGGGRYDNLVEEIGDRSVPAVGFALGVERLLLELEAQGVKFKTGITPTLQLIYFPDTASYAQSLALRLREAGIATEIDVCARSFKAQMKYANKLGAKYVIVIGEAEQDTGKAILKRMADAHEEDCILDDIAQLARLMEV